MARIAVIAAMPIEIEGFVQEHHAQVIESKGFYMLYKAAVGSNEVFLACCGIGKVNAAICTQKLIDTFGVEYIINMGIAGGVSKKLETLDIVIGSEVLYYDFDPASLLSKYFPFCEAFACDKRMIELSENVCRSGSDTSRYFVGRVATGDRFVEDVSLKSRIDSELGGLCCDMEGAGIGQTAFINSIPFIIIRSISDLADGNAQMTYDEFEKKAARQANRIVNGLIEAIQ